MAAANCSARVAQDDGVQVAQDDGTHSGRRLEDAAASERAEKRQRTLRPPYVVDFADGVEAILAALDEWGAVRVDGVFEDAFCDEVQSGIVDYLVGLGTGFDPNGDWEGQKHLLPPQTRRGMFQALVSCMPVFHAVDTDARLQSIFKAAFDTDALVVSGDGMNWQPAGGPPVKHWDHLDQTRGDVNDCIQGAANFADSDAGTVVWLRSHRIFKSLMAATGTDSPANWMMIAKDAKLLDLARGLMAEVDGAQERVTIPSVKGSVTLWLSSVIHAGQDGERCVRYVSYRPRTLGPRARFGRPMTKAEMKRRAKAFRGKRHTPHWANKLMPKKPGDWRGYLGNPYHPAITAFLADPASLPHALSEHDIPDEHKPLYCLDIE